MPVWLLDLLTVLAIYRATRFLVVDEFPPVRWPRDFIVTWLDPTAEQRAANPKMHPHWGGLGRSIAYLAGCPWCMSAWVGAAIVWAVTEFVSLPMPVLVWAAGCAITGLIASAESEHEQRYKLRDFDIKQRETEARR